MSVHHIDAARSWRNEFVVQRDALQYAAGGLIDQLIAEGQHSQAAAAVEAAAHAAAALGALSRLGLGVTGVRRGLG